MLPGCFLKGSSPDIPMTRQLSGNTTPQGTDGSSLQKASLARRARFLRKPLSPTVLFGLLFALPINMRLEFVVSENNLHLKTYVEF